MSGRRSGVLNGPKRDPQRSSIYKNEKEEPRAIAPVRPKYGQHFIAKVPFLLCFGQQGALLLHKRTGHEKKFLRFGMIGVVIDGTLQDADS